MNELWDRRGLLDDLLARGVDDWIGLGEVVDVARRTGVTSDEALATLAVGLVSIVLLEGLMQAGAVGDGGFEPWQVAPGDAVARIVREWRLHGTQILLPGDIAWLRNTAEGTARGQAVLASEAESM